MFEEEIEAIGRAKTRIINAQWEPELGDPRNLDPDDEPLYEMYQAAGQLQEAAEALQEACSAEMSRRDALLDELDDKAYAKWKREVYGTGA